MDDLRYWFLASAVLLSLSQTLPLGYAADTNQTPQKPAAASAPAAVPSAAPSQGPTEIEVKDVSDRTITFVGPNAPKPVKTGLFDLEYIATLKPHDGSMPYFLFAANPCSNCSAERSLYLVRPKDAAKPQISQFVYPGRILDPRTHLMVLDSRAFYGRCLSPRRGDPGDDVYVVFQRERVTLKHRHRRHVRILDSVYVAHASSDFLRDQLIEHRLPSLRRTIALVRKHRCHELSGRNRFLELHPKGLDWRNIHDDTDNPDDDASGDPGSD